MLTLHPANQPSILNVSLEIYKVIIDYVTMVLIEIHIKITIT